MVIDFNASNSGQQEAPILRRAQANLMPQASTAESERQKSPRGEAAAKLSRRLKQLQH